ncbi:MAG: hypothetical protein AAF902_14850 [Chloroflexota bacterium]
MQDIEVNSTESKDEKRGYEPPAIIFESTISTRAGSPVIESDAPQPPDQDGGTDLFPDD